MPRTNGRVVKRVTWKVTRCAGTGGWLPVVLIGEVPIYFASHMEKATAKKTARVQCAILRGAGQ